MYFNKYKKNEIQSRFNSYVLSIREDLLSQMVSNESSSRSYLERRYDELFNKYLDTINIFNYNETCSKFIHDVYGLIPVNDTL